MTSSPPLPVVASPPAPRPPQRADLARVTVAGLNAWLVVGLLPTVHLGMDDAVSVGLTVAPLAVLGVGVALLARHRVAASWVLLALFPPALGGAIVRHDAPSARDAYDALTATLGALSLLAFLAAAAHAAARSRRPHVATPHPIQGKPPVEEPAGRRWLRRVLLGSAWIGALAIAVVAPSRPDRAARARAWGEAAEDGAVLVAVVAALAASVALAAVVGPALRAERRATEAPTARRRALATALALALAALAGWAALTLLDGR